MNPFQAFVQHSSFHYKDFLIKMAEIVIDHDKLKELEPNKSALTKMIHKGIDKEKARTIFFEGLSDIDVDTRYLILADVIDIWDDTHYEHVFNIVNDFIFQFSPLPIDMEGLSAPFSSHNNGLGRFLRSLSKFRSSCVLETLLAHNNIDLNVSDQHERLEKFVSVFSLLVYWQANYNEGDKGIDYLDRLLKEPIDRENEGNKDALYYLFLNPNYAKVLSRHGFSLYETSERLYERIEASAPNYAVTIMRDIFDQKESPELEQYNAALKKEDKKNPSLFFKPFFDNKMITEALFHFASEAKERHEAEHVEYSTDLLMTFFKSYLGEGWLWDSKSSRIFTMLKKIEDKRLTCISEHVMSNTPLKTLLSGVKTPDDVKRIADHRNITPYDMLFETEHVRARRVITETIGA